MENMMNQLVEYNVGNETVKLTPNVVKNYLVSGNKDAVSLQEVVMFINLCKYNQLNPWVNEAYLIKFGNEPATMVVGKEAFQKRAEENKNYDGSDAGIIVITKEGKVIYRKGTLKLPDEQIVGGYAEVWRKDRGKSTRIEVSFDEYVGRKKDGSINSQWSKRPATMIRKVALVQALREAFPGKLGGIYTAEEQGVQEPNLDYRYKQIDTVQAQDAFMDADSQQDGIERESQEVGGLELEEVEE
ncbi:MAG: phage recombination protein Bet [Lachnospiraceae bacterium]|nr:phage recombination protein Bet [Lachnospiraceae bacterium]